jgi:hypothetical protein
VAAGRPAPSRQPVFFRLQFRKQHFPTPAFFAIPPYDSRQSHAAVPEYVRLQTLGAAALIVVAAACGGGDVGPPSFLGDYSLRSVNGDLPFRIYHNDTDGQWIFDVVSGTMVLNADNSFKEILVYHVTPPPTAQEPFQTETPTEGKYSVDGSTVTFTYSPDNRPPYSWRGTILDGTLTYTDPLFTDVDGGVTAVYFK